MVELPPFKGKDVGSVPTEGTKIERYHNWLMNYPDKVGYNGSSPFFSTIAELVLVASTPGFQPGRESSSLLFCTT